MAAALPAPSGFELSELMIWFSGFAGAQPPVFSARRAGAIGEHR